jgi:hypothetical protein
LQALQARLLDAPPTPAPRHSDESAPAPRGADARDDGGEAPEETPNGEAEDEAAPEAAGVARGANRAAAARRAEAVRVLKQLLEAEAGGNKTD